MALADYRLCDLCESKTFYDANLSWNDPDEKHRDSWLYGLGDWAVICEECAKTHECVVRPKSERREALAAIAASDAELI